MRAARGEEGTATTSADGGRARPARRRARVAAEGVFFPAATLYGAVAVPLSVHGMLSGDPLLPGFAGVAGHAHELLFGFALAVVAGFLVTRASRLRIAALAGLWVLARAAFLAQPGGVAAAAANAAFAGVLGATVAPQFLRGAKKLRNRAIAPLLLALCLAAVGFQVAQLGPRPGARLLVVDEAVLLFALLMLFMGGRIIAPAAAGAIERAGGHLRARVQPRVEGALLGLVPLAMVALAVPRGRAVAGVLALAAAVLAGVRLARWRLWQCRARPDLWCLGLGYAWLAVGLALLGLAWSLGHPAAGTATHAITVGALGTLSTAVMARVRLVRNRRDPGRARLLPWIALAIALAALLRLAGGAGPVALGAAAALWSLGLLALLALLLRVPAR